MVTRVTGRMHLSLLLTAFALLALAAFALPKSATPRSLVAGTLPCTTGTTFNLKAASGRISTPDGGSVFMWGFAKNPGNFQMPGPILCVTQGATVTVNLLNNLAEPVSIVFPGQTGVTATGGSAGLFTNEATASGGTVSYTFTAGEPGTYLYESGTNPHKQVQMGLYGALIVRPTMGPGYAYNDAATQFNPAREYLLLLHDMDPDLHRAVERGEPYDVTTKHDRYWTINGRSFPDTIAADGASYLPSQPYGALVRVRPYDAAANPLPALIRYANAGMSNHPFHPHGNHLRVIAQDGRLLGAGTSLSMEQFTQTAGSGQTFDMLFKWTNVEGFSPTHPVPVTIPTMRQLVFKDNVTWYSGSPYLGKKASFPSGVVSFNRCGEYYYPWHSHALNEFQNFNEGFGGLATLLRVDPPVGQGSPPSCPGP